MMLKKSILQTSFGPMVAVADDTFLYLLQFADSFLLEKQIAQLQKNLTQLLIEGSNDLIKKLEQEMQSYFRGDLKKFTIPLYWIGSDFQKNVWRHCFDIEYGSTVPYQGLAKNLNNDRAFRAVGTALGSNCHVLIIPCHRVIKSDGRIGDYAAGIDRKVLLLAHEQLFKDKN
jgi:AraC family transcriptional regulator of adaptative response/methylated-DNA-[protein]-cysteine methyltransferase